MPAFKMEWNPAKAWAYMLSARFVATVNTPVKIVSQIFSSLLRVSEHESRSMSRNALDVLVPALPAKFPGSIFRPTWLKWVKRMFQEESSNFTGLAHVWEMILRHSDLFYPCRSSFLQQLVCDLFISID